MSIHVTGALKCSFAAKPDSSPTLQAPRVISAMSDELCNES